MLITIKATKNISIWLERGDPPVRFNYRTTSEQQMVTKIFLKQSGYQILKAFRRYETWRYVFYMGRTVFYFKATWDEIKKFP